MQLASSASDSRFPAPTHQEQPYTAAPYASTGAYNQYPQGLPGQPEARADGRQTFQLDPPPDSAGKSTATRTRKRKTPPPQGGEEANTAPPPTGPGQQQFAYAAESPVQPPTSEQTQQGPGYPLDPSIQSFANDGGGATDREQEGRPSATPAASGNPRIVNPSKRAEQNRKAQRAFRERRDAHVKDLEGRSVMLDQVMMDLAETNRRFEECRHMVDALRSENQRLTAALQQYTGGQLPPGFAQPAYPNGPPPAEAEGQSEANPGIMMHHAPPIESISHPPANNEPEAPAATQSGTEDGGTQDDAGRKSKRSKR